MYKLILMTIVLYILLYSDNTYAYQNRNLHWLHTSFSDCWVVYKTKLISYIKTSIIPNHLKWFPFIYSNLRLDYIQQPMVSMHDSQYIKLLH